MSIYIPRGSRLQIAGCSPSCPSRAGRTTGPPGHSNPAGLSLTLLYSLTFVRQEDGSQPAPSIEEVEVDGFDDHPIATAPLGRKRQRKAVATNNMVIANECSTYKVAADVRRRGTALGDDSPDEERPLPAQKPQGAADAPRRNSFLCATGSTRPKRAAQTKKTTCAHTHTQHSYTPNKSITQTHNRSRNAVG